MGNEVRLVYRDKIKELLGHGEIEGPLAETEVERRSFFSVNRAVRACRKAAVKYARKKGYDIVCPDGICTSFFDFSAREEYQFYMSTGT